MKTIKQKGAQELLLRYELLLALIASFLCLTTMVVAVDISLAKPGCEPKCGNVTIPYPFGIGTQCSAEPSFQIICNNSNPILSSLELEVEKISLESSLIIVKQPVSPIACSSVQKRQPLGVSLAQTPFYFSKLNTLLVLGCQNAVWLHANETSNIGGCVAICDPNSTDTTCNGLNCCKVLISEERRQIDFTYKSIEAFSANTSCGYVFLAGQNWIQDDYTNYTGLLRNLSNPFDAKFKYTTMTLKWVLSNHNFSFYASGGCNHLKLQRNPSSEDTYEYDHNYGQLSYPICSCMYGFEGNPYLTDGCHDINECNNSKLNSCGRSVCVNTRGSYYCLPSIDTTTRRPNIAFIIPGSVLVTLVLLFVSIKCSRILFTRIKANRKLKFFKRNGGLLLNQHLAATDSTAEKIKLFRSKELNRATDHYSENRVLGCGGQGTVYKGMLADGRIVAVKKSKKIDEGDIETFINEIVILSQINHRNVVKLIGCCLETEIPLLVYEFIPNGTLFQHIHEPNEEFPFTWEMRVRIATEVANSLSYLHSAASTPIYHRDIKSTNILLDDKFRAKVSDFGTSRKVAIDQTHLTTKVLGTFGYLDPEYFQSSQFTEKSDVYSFGVVMAELLTGEKAVIGSETGKSLATHFLQSMEENHLFQVLDAQVEEEGREEEILAMAQIAKRCLRLNGKKRPTMKEVAATLEAIQKSKEWQLSIDEEEASTSFQDYPLIIDEP